MKYVPFQYFLIAAILEVAKEINEILDNQSIQEEENTQEAEDNGGFSIVGMRIVPSDNSYATCLDSGCEASVYGKEFVCMSDPYTKKVKSRWNTEDEGYKYDMVKIFSLRSGRTYECLFKEQDLVED